MTGRLEQTLTGATSSGGRLSCQRNALFRRSGPTSWRQWLGFVAGQMVVVLGWAFVMLLVSTALVFAVATAIGYQWPGLWSPALPVPLTPEPGLDL